MDRRSELDTVQGRQEQSQERGREHTQKPAASKSVGGHIAGALQAAPTAGEISHPRRIARGNPTPLAEAASLLAPLPKTEVISKSRGRVVLHISHVET